MYGFSTENWKRPATEVSLLMSLIREYLLGNVRDMHEHNVRIRFIAISVVYPKNCNRLLLMQNN